VPGVEKVGSSDQSTDELDEKRVDGKPIRHLLGILILFSPYV
jgi:hypothetical protein